MALYQYLTLLSYLPAALYVAGVIDTLAVHTVVSQKCLWFALMYCWLVSATLHSIAVVCCQMMPQLTLKFSGCTPLIAKVLQQALESHKITKCNCPA